MPVKTERPALHELWRQASAECRWPESGERYRELKREHGVEGFKGELAAEAIPVPARLRKVAG